MTGRQILLAMAIIALTFSGVAYADPLAPPRSPAAVEHLRIGNRYLDLEKYDAAVAEYEKGALLEPVPVFWLNIGLAHRKAGRHAEAVRYYRTFLAKVERDPAAADIRAKVERIIADLEAVASRPPAEPQPSGTGGPPAMAVTTPPPSAEAGPRWYQDTLGWVLAGAGVAALAVGTGFHASASSLESRADGEPDQSERRRLLDTADSRRTIGTIALVGGAGLIVAGAVKLAMTPERNPRAPASALRPGPGDLGIALVIDF